MSHWKYVSEELPEDEELVYIRVIGNYRQYILSTYQASFRIFSSTNFQVSWSEDLIVKWKSADGTATGMTPRGGWFFPDQDLPEDSEECYLSLGYWDSPIIEAVYDSVGNTWESDITLVSYSANLVTKWKPRPV
jgi:hypothetical protein